MLQLPITDQHWHFAFIRSPTMELWQHLAIHVCSCMQWYTKSANDAILCCKHMNKFQHISAAKIDLKPSPTRPRETRRGRPKMRPGLAQKMLRKSKVDSQVVLKTVIVCNTILVFQCDKETIIISQTCVRSQCAVDVWQPIGLHLIHAATASVRPSLFPDNIAERCFVSHHQKSTLLTSVLLVNTIF